MKNFGYFVLLVTPLVLGCQNFSNEAASVSPHQRISTVRKKEHQEVLTPALALQHLKEGNQRFREGRQLHRDHNAQRGAGLQAQHPFAIFLGCMDSRSSAELIFDQGIGDIFNVRNAGNVVNEDVLGSLEYGCLVAGAKVIVVLGHTRCGAVKGACEGAEMGNLTTLLQKIEPSVEKIVGPKPRKKPTSELVEATGVEHVHQMVRAIKQRSPLLAKAMNEGRIGIHGGIYNLETGEARFVD